ncbi:MAG: hypothetical protein AB7K24_03625 [Gemmataceae bacterium]
MQTRAINAMKLILATATLWCAAPAQAQTVVYGKKPCYPAPYIPCPTPCPEVKPIDPTQPPTQPPDMAQQPAVEPTISPEQFAATGGGETFAAAAPQVIGDLSGSGLTGVRASSFKVSENMTVRPQTRAFFGYNYFNNVGGIANVHRQMPGFEYAFLDNNASFGMSLPIFETEQSGNPLVLNGFGNLNLFGKYAIINNVETGNILTGGMQLTVPTGRGLPLPDGTQLYTAIFQPFAGYFVNATDRFYFQGFTSLAVPTDSKDITILFNDIAAGFWAVRNGNNGIIPTIEAHVTTPLNNRGANAIFTLQDIVVLTGGLHFLTDRFTFTLGAATPITGPQPYDIDAIGQINWRWGYRPNPGFLN